MQNSIPPKGSMDKTDSEGSVVKRSDCGEVHASPDSGTSSETPRAKTPEVGTRWSMSHVIPSTQAEDPSAKEQRRRGRERRERKAFGEYLLQVVLGFVARVIAYAAFLWLVVTVLEVGFQGRSLSYSIRSSAQPGFLLVYSAFGLVGAILQGQKKSPLE